CWPESPASVRSDLPGLCRLRGERPEAFRPLRKTGRVHGPALTHARAGSPDPAEPRPALRSFQSSIRSSMAVVRLRAKSVAAPPPPTATIAAVTRAVNELPVVARLPPEVLSSTTSSPDAFSRAGEPPS